MCLEINPGQDSKMILELSPDPFPCGFADDPSKYGLQPRVKPVLVCSRKSIPFGFISDVRPSWETLRSILLGVGLAKWLSITRPISSLIV